MGERACACVRAFVLYVFWQGREENVNVNMEKNILASDGIQNKQIRHLRAFENHDKYVISSTYNIIHYFTNFFNSPSYVFHLFAFLFHIERMKIAEYSAQYKWDPFSTQIILYLTDRYKAKSARYENKIPIRMAIIQAKLKETYYRQWKIIQSTGCTKYDRRKINIHKSKDYNCYRF